MRFRVSATFPHPDGTAVRFTHVYRRREAVTAWRMLSVVPGVGRIRVVQIDY